MTTGSRDDDARRHTAVRGHAGAEELSAHVTAASRPRLEQQMRAALEDVQGCCAELRVAAEAQERAGDAASLAHVEEVVSRLKVLLDASVALHPEPAGAAGGAVHGGEAGDAVAREAPARASLLVVDDSDVNRLLLTRRLEQQGYAVQAAVDGPAALDLVAREQFDLILLDVMMPGMSGLEVLRTIRAQRTPADLPVVMATALDASEDIVEALRLGANDYVTKPLDMPVVLARVAGQLALKRAKEEVERLNARLEEAQGQLARWMESGTQAVQDVTTWARSGAVEVARALGVGEVSIWTCEREQIQHLAGSHQAPPTPSELDLLQRRGEAVERGADTLLPVAGLSGELFGVLLVRGARLRTDALARRLLTSFAWQLGGALELRRTRRELEEAEARRRRQREELAARGIELLRLCPECGRAYGPASERCDDDGVALDSPSTLPFRVADRYRMARVLGEGGMGTVLEGYDERLDRAVAIKVIKAEHFDDETVRLRFENEARAVARIDHPGVIAVYDSGELADGSLYIVMELVRGHELDELVAACGRGTPAQVAALARQGAAALSAAHAAGIVHRDIKPANIILTPAPEGFRVKLLDFGVAKQMKIDAHLTVTGTILGTPRYMSPEQLLCHPVDARSDLYSFAAVLFLALSGRAVTTRTQFPEVLIDVLERTPPALSRLCPELPREIDAAFERALAKAPEQRPASVQEWVDTFVDLLEELPATGAGWTVDVEDLPLPQPTAPSGAPIEPAPTRALKPKD